MLFLHITTLHKLDALRELATGIRFQRAGLVYLVLLLSLSLLGACASRQTSLVSEAEVSELEDFSEFEDAFTKAAERSVVGNYDGKGKASNLLIYFDFNSAYLAEDSRVAVDVEIANILASNSNSDIRVLGHTDERGSDGYNLALGQRRADTVRRYMITKGVDSSRIQAVSYGEKQPLSLGSNEASWAENRRVELIY